MDFCKQVLCFSYLWILINNYCSHLFIDNYFEIFTILVGKEYTTYHQYAIKRTQKQATMIDFVGFFSQHMFQASIENNKDSKANSVQFWKSLEIFVNFVHDLCFWAIVEQKLLTES